MFMTLRCCKNFFGNSPFYILIFFFPFHTGDRFAIYFYPFLALAGGYGISRAWEYHGALKNIAQGLVIFSISIAFIFIARLDWLTVHNDTRAQARQWIEHNIPPGEKIVVLAPLTRLSSTPEAIKEQGSLDTQSLRKVDKAESDLVPQSISYPQYHALNLYTVGTNGIAFYNNPEDYIKKNNYHYALVSDTDWGKDEQKIFARNVLLSRGVVLKTFSGHSLQDFDATEGSIGDVRNLFTVSSFGPTTYIYHLQ